jgi:hypothetical protein
MNMSEHGKERVKLDIILKDRPVFLIRWGLVVFVMIVFTIFFFIYYAGYDILLYRQR